MVSKRFVGVRKAGHMVVALAVGRERECVVTGQALLVQKTKSHLLVPFYQTGTLKTRKAVVKEFEENTENLMTDRRL